MQHRSSPVKYKFCPPFHAVGSIRVGGGASGIFLVLAFLVFFDLFSVFLETSFASAGKKTTQKIFCGRGAKKTTDKGKRNPHSVYAKASRQLMMPLR